LPEQPLTRSCDQCGAVYDEGADCESCFHALLAYENERPAAFGAVHHLTVAAYYLQHPAGYTHESLAHWREIIARTLDGTATVRELRELSGRRFAGSKRARAPGASAPDWWPRVWPMTIRDLITPDTSIELDAYVDRARDWAGATLRALDAAGVI
jgi:hypothetical protein